MPPTPETTHQPHDHCGFEGPEKRLEVDFKLSPSHPLGLRSLNADEWQKLLDFAACKIISQKSNEFLDSYVLSESSLFVYADKMVLKTCGTTTLLRVIPTLLEYAQKCHCSIELLKYSRKNLFWPNRQLFPHNNWDTESEFLNHVFQGTPCVLGPANSDHWFCYVADFRQDSDEVVHVPPTVDIMMQGLAPSVSPLFYGRKGSEKFPGIAELIPGSETDEFNFEPCGYSMNGLFGRYYYTIHVTPEQECSYASFETNAPVENYSELVSNVLAIFKPSHFTIALTGDSDHPEPLPHLSIPQFLKSHSTSSTIEGTSVVMHNFDSVSKCDAAKRKKPSSVLDTATLKKQFSFLTNSHAMLQEVTTQ